MGRRQRRWTGCFEGDAKRRASLDQVLRKVGERRIHVVEDVLKVMMNWLGCAEENVAGPEEGRRKN